jgi:hypothetical protein
VTAYNTNRSNTNVFSKLLEIFHLNYKRFFTIKKNIYNKELYDLFKEPKLSITIRIARLRWAGHVRRMDEEAVPGRVMYVTPIGQRKTGRPKACWRDERMQEC